MGTMQAWMFFAAVVGLFGWGIWLGLSAMTAEHLPWNGNGSARHGPNGGDNMTEEEKRDLWRTA